LSKRELIEELKKRNPRLNHKDLENVLNTFSECVQKALTDEKNIELRGFGTFFIKKIKEKYSARNPKSGKLIYVPEKNKVRFKPSKKLKKLINK
tara:strand:- start:246 stop:527 length:282 start_codon:yes stop_codon:yes gene_type:complete